VTDLVDRQQLQKSVKQICPQIIFHIAASGVSPAQKDRQSILNTNVLGTLNLLQATAQIAYERFVYTGSSLEYGVKNTPMKETDMLEPSTFFGMSKAAQTLLCQQFAKEHFQPIVVLRLFSVYGYWESPKRLVPTVIRAALRNQEIALTVPGYRRDFVFIEDVIEACLLAVKANISSGEIINVGSGQQWGNEDVADIVQTLVSDWKFQVNVGGYPAHRSDTPFWVSDIQKAKRLLGWEPRYTLKIGLEKTIAWFRLHQQTYIK
jgi:nucleoside-diphosphate-sugar epimerase